MAYARIVGIVAVFAMTVEAGMPIDELQETQQMMALLEAYAAAKESNLGLELSVVIGEFVAANPKLIIQDWTEDEHPVDVLAKHIFPQIQQTLDYAAECLKDEDEDSN